MVNRTRAQVAMAVRTAAAIQQTVDHLVAEWSNRPFRLNHLSLANVMEKRTEVLAAPEMKSGWPQSEAPALEMYEKCWLGHISG